MSSIGIISALPFESKYFTGYSHPLNKPVCITDKLYLVTSGMGFDCASHAVEQLFNFNITTLISWGTAAGLIDTLHSGDLVLPDKILSSSGQILVTDKEWNLKLEELMSDTTINLNKQPLYSDDVMLETPEDKTGIHLKTGAAAADMESYVIALKATEKNVPFLVIRTIIDESETSLPACITNNIDNFGRTNNYQLLLDLIRSPSQITSLYKLTLAMTKAGKTLKTTAKILLDFLEKK